MAMAQVDEENTIRDSLLDNIDDSNAGEEEEEEEEDLPDVPLEPYMTYAKFACRFAKWILPLCIFNVVAMIIHDFAYREPWFSSFVAGVFILNTIFFFLAARAIDRDVAKVDEELQSQEQSGTENPTTDWNNYENIYGKAARKIDAWLASACRTQPVTTEERPTGTTSFLSHVCWILWAFSLASAYSMTVDLAYQKVFPGQANKENASHTSPDISNISHLPENVQNWITGSWEHDYDFPINRHDTLVPFFEDRLLLWESQRSDSGNGWEHLHQLGDSKDGVTELFAFNGRLERRMHRDIVEAHLAIPVQSSISKDDELRASQYCFLSKSRSLLSIDFCNEEAQCADSSRTGNGKELILENVSLDWQGMKSSVPGAKDRFCRLTWQFETHAASYQDLVFFQKASVSYSFLEGYREVIQLNPATMETSTIFRQNGRVRHGDDMYLSRNSFNYLLFFNGICGLVFASYYLIAKLGMVSGVFPLAYAFSFVLNMLIRSAFSNTFITWAFSVLFLTMGMLFLLYSITTDRKWSKLPAWIGKDVYTWALYGWISSNRLLPFVPYYIFRNEEELKVLYLCISALYLGLPIIQALGYIFVISGVLEIIVEFNWFLMDPFESLSTIFIGLGLVVSGNWITAHKEGIYARGNYVFWYLKKWFRVRFRQNLSRR